MLGSSAMYCEHCTLFCCVCVCVLLIPLQNVVCTTHCSAACVQVFHGTHPPSNAQSIARRGPDFSLIGSANGHVYGRGFYTTTFIDTAASYATSKGAICVCAAVLGNIKSNGSSEDTAGSLLQQGYHSVVAAGTRVTVLFHPDAVHVEYIINDVADPTAEKALAAKQEQLDAAWRHQDLVRQKNLQVRLFAEQSTLR